MGNVVVCKQECEQPRCVSVEVPGRVSSPTSSWPTYGLPTSGQYESKMHSAKNVWILDSDPFLGLVIYSMILSYETGQLQRFPTRQLTSSDNRCSSVLCRQPRGLSRPGPLTAFLSFIFPTYDRPTGRGPHCKQSIICNPRFIYTMDHEVPVPWTRRPGTF